MLSKKLLQIVAGIALLLVIGGVSAQLVSAGDSYESWSAAPYCTEPNEFCKEKDKPKPESEIGFGFCQVWVGSELKGQWGCEAVDPRSEEALESLDERWSVRAWKAGGSIESPSHLEYFGDFDEAVEAFEEFAGSTWRDSAWVRLCLYDAHGKRCDGNITRSQ